MVYRKQTQKQLENGRMKRGTYKPKQSNIIKLEKYLNETIKEHKKGVGNDNNR